MNEYLNFIGGTVDEYTESAEYYDALEEEKTERYIDSGALLSYLDIEHEKEKCDFTKDFYSGVEFVCYEIEQFPKADVAPVVHARWIFDGKDPYNEHANLFTCSKCGLGRSFHTNPPAYNHCPWCGAKMNEEVEDD